MKCENIKYYWINSIHNCEDAEKLRTIQEVKTFLKAEILKEKLGKQEFHCDMEEDFEPVTENQVQEKKLFEKQAQAWDDSSQITIQAIEYQTKTVQVPSNALNKTLQKSNDKQKHDCDGITTRYLQLIGSLVNSNLVDTSIGKLVSNLLNDENKSQFSFKRVEGSSSHSQLSILTLKMF